MEYQSGVSGGTEAGNADMAPPLFRVCYQAQNTQLFSDALGQLPEFTRGKVATGEEFTWLAPDGPTATPQAVAVVRLTERTVEIESQSRKGLQAMQVLIEEVGGNGIQLVP